MNLAFMLLMAAQPLTGHQPAPAHRPHRVPGTNVVVNDDPHEDLGELADEMPADSEGPFTYCTLAATAVGEGGPIWLVSTPVGPSFSPPTPAEFASRLAVSLRPDGQAYRCFTNPRWAGARAAIDAMRREREAAGGILYEIFWPAELIDR